MFIVHQVFCLLWNNFHKRNLLVLWESQLAWSRRVYYHKSQSILVSMIVSQQSRNPITHEGTDPCKSVYTLASTSIKLRMELINECISDDQRFPPVKVLQNTNAPFPIQHDKTNTLMFTQKENPQIQQRHSHSLKMQKRTEVLETANRFPQVHVHTIKF